MKKDRPKTMAELTKDYEEVAKRNNYGEVTKEDFEKKLRSAAKPKDSKDKKK